MKRLLTVLLTLILCLSLLASCNQQPDEPLPQTSDDPTVASSDDPTAAPSDEPTAPPTSEPATVSTEEPTLSEEPVTQSTATNPPSTEPSTSINNEHQGEDESMIMGYVFYSAEDFKTYYLTGSTELSLYNKPPQDGFFPAYQMQEGGFVELSDLFPTLNFENLTDSNVSVSWLNNYSYLCFTKDTNIPLSVTIRYVDAYINESVESRLNYGDNSGLDKIIRSDYHTAIEKPSKTSGSMIYIFELNDCIISYAFHNDISTGLTIHKGNFSISISSFYTNMQDNSFFTDETLAPILCLFENGEARLNALNQIAEFIDSKPLVGEEPGSTEIPNAPWDKPSSTTAAPETGTTSTSEPVATPTEPTDTEVELATSRGEDETLPEPDFTYEDRPETWEQEPEPVI